MRQWRRSYFERAKWTLALGELEVAQALVNQAADGFQREDESQSATLTFSGMRDNSTQATLDVMIHRASTEAASIPNRLDEVIYELTQRAQSAPYVRLTIAQAFEPIALAERLRIGPTEEFLIRACAEELGCQYTPAIEIDINRPYPPEIIVHPALTPHLHRLATETAQSAISAHRQNQWDSSLNLFLTASIPFGMARDMPQHVRARLYAVDAMHRLGQVGRAKDFLESLTGHIDATMRLPFLLRLAQNAAQGVDQEDKRSLDSAIDRIDSLIDQAHPQRFSSGGEVAAMQVLQAQLLALSGRMEQARYLAREASSDLGDHEAIERLNQFLEDLEENGHRDP